MHYRVTVQREPKRGYMPRTVRVDTKSEALKIARDEMSADPLQPWWYVAVERVTRSWAPPKTIARWEARENRWHQTVDD